MDNPSSTTGVNLSSSENEPERLKKFKIVVHNAIEQIASGVSEEEYAQQLGGLKALGKSKPMKMQQTMREKLLKNLTKEINGMMKDEEIDAKFKKLDKYIDDCALYEGETTWRPKGNVTEDMRSHSMAMKLKHKAELEELVREREYVTDRLKNQVICLRNQATSLASMLETTRDRVNDCQLLDRINKNLQVTQID